MTIWYKLFLMIASRFNHNSLHCTCVQLTIPSLCMIQIRNFFTSNAPKILSSYQYWLDNGVKIVSLQFRILRPFIYNEKLTKRILRFSLLHKNPHIIKHKLNFYNTKTTQSYIFANYQYTSPFTMTNLHAIDHSISTRYQRNYDLIKQNFCLLPHNATSRPLIVSREYLKDFDVFCCLAVFLHQSSKH